MGRLLVTLVVCGLIILISGPGSYRAEALLFERTAYRRADETCSDSGYVVRYFWNVPWHLYRSLPL